MRSKGSLLIVDDNEDVLFSLKLLLSKHFDHIRTERNPNLIPAIIAKESYDLYLLDMNFSAGVSSGNEGIFWMKKILEADPAAVIVFITAYGDVELAVKALKEGATDFIQKPWEKEKLLSTLRNAYRIRSSSTEISSLKQKQRHLTEDISRQYDLVLGPSSAIRSLMNTIGKVAVTDANVLILGENGTGKEVIAREIHRRSVRCNEVFVPVDMGALTGSLFESELFGHSKGSFTGATEDRAGRFEIASGGTLFLDEIGNLSLDLQAKLLTVLQNREVVRLGTHKPLPVDIRLICASNKPLHRMVEEGLFREDLLYRINTIQLGVPPLRERREDIPGLVNFFLEKFSRKYGYTGLSISEREMQRLQQYSWPGNVRELQHYIEKAVILSDSGKLSLEEPRAEILEEQQTRKYSILNLDENERNIIGQAIREHNGNLSAASQALGISRKTLYNKIDKYGL
jgi:DNA-binding NtrC family response regulator